jgi:hypothetical protein
MPALGEQNHAADLIVERGGTGRKSVSRTCVAITCADVPLERNGMARWSRRADISAAAGAVR